MITTWSEAIEAFNDDLDLMFDTAYGEIFLGYGHGAVKITNASRVLREYDPVAYRTSFHDWADFRDIDTDQLEGVDRLP